MIVVGLTIAAIGFACLIGFLWTGRQPYRLGGTYRIQCRICKAIYEIDDPTVDELKAQQALVAAHEERCIQGTGP